MHFVELIPSKPANSSTTSVYYDLVDITKFSIQVFFTGTNLEGVLVLQASNEPANGFVDVDGSSKNVTYSENHMWDVTEIGFRYVRVKWTYSTGSGNIYSSLFTKKDF
jgi:hypothetical protein